MVKANYKYHILLDDLIIEDLNGTMSVTNCIEDVIEEICEKEQVNPNTLLIVYKDSEGRWDGWDNVNQSFVLLDCTNSQDALNKLHIHYYDKKR